MILRSKLLSYKCKYYALAQLRMGHIWLQLPESFSFSFQIKSYQHASQSHEQHKHVSPQFWRKRLRVQL